MHNISLSLFHVLIVVAGTDTVPASAVAKPGGLWQSNVDCVKVPVVLIPVLLFPFIVLAQVPADIHLRHQIPHALRRRAHHGGGRAFFYRHISLSASHRMID